jgi:uncharacterized protein
VTAVSQPAPAPGPAPYDEAREWRAAWQAVLLVLVTLTVVKPLGRFPVIGTIAFTVAAGLQLYLPLWRCEKLGLPYDWVGLHTKALRRDLQGVLLLCLVTFPFYVVGHHLYMTQARAWAYELELPMTLVRHLPAKVLAPALPDGLWAWSKATFWFVQMAATHALGVALPEETFYRGYFMPRLQERWRPLRRYLGAPLGRAALVTATLFALGHFLGEWNPLRLGPFFPALVFAWQRNRTGSVVGAVTFHALCNILGEILFSLYRNP